MQVGFELSFFNKINRVTVMIPTIMKLIAIIIIIERIFLFVLLNKCLNAKKTMPIWDMITNMFL